ncbi:GGDEF domain-containing protein [Shimia sp. Alg240-R146]|uniref:GGDEF domain-containing protein n=1 Tax=Shimia sp. Alg240-R146 TaxID=2993449 RepID=UPI0022E39741|nr:diguanylate cyclase [Shimia sp. Alg240-R146]
MLQLMRSVHFTFIFCISAAFIAAAPVAAPAQQPEFDLRHIDFRDDGTATLSGDWFFSHGALMSPAQAHASYMDNSMSKVAVPNSWAAHLPTNAENPHHAGYGSYVARVRLPEGVGAKLMLDVLRISDAYEIYWIPLNAPERAWRVAAEGTMTGPLMASHGHKGHSLAMAEDGLMLINVRGGLTSDNGIIQQLRLFHGTQFQALVQTERLIIGALIGIVLIVGSVNLSLFVFHRKDIATLVLTLAAVTLLVRMILLSDMIETLFGLEWRTFRLRLEYANSLFLFWTAMMLNQALLWQQIRNWRIIVGHGVISVLGILLCVFAPLPLVTQMWIGAEVFAVATSAAILISCGTAAIHRTPNAMFFFACWSAVAATAAFDAMTTSYFIHVLQTLHIAFVLGITAGTVQVGRRVIMAINRAEFLEEERALLQKLHQDAVDTARRDHLTGLLNRQAFDDELAHAWLQHEKDDSHLSLILFDIDRFKAINDTHGHPVGDKVLRSVADLLSNTRMRKSDRVCRYGGEEFAIILPDTSGEDAFKVAERIRKSIAGHVTGCADDLTLIVTCSFGVATANANQPDDPSQLLEQADAALYRAKANGRNRTERHEMPNAVAVTTDAAQSA